jgi:hypothetical protein
MTAPAETRSWEEIKALFAETDRKFQETDRKFQETEAQMREVFERFDNLSRRFGDLGNRLGEFVEAMVEPERKIKDTHLLLTSFPSSAIISL